MARASEWFEGLRLRTLPAALAPVIVGTGAAAAIAHPNWLRAALAAIVALALQVGVNFANDYSDGVRGTDKERVGPQRLVGSGAASPKAVKTVAFGCFALAGLAGLALVAICGEWWLLLVGLTTVPAAWFYTGGRHPYGYRGLGEVGVFIYFGPVAVLGTTYTQVLTLSLPAVLGAISIGLLACAILMLNNIRDIGSDTRSGKRTWAVRLGARRARGVYTGQLILALALGLCCAVATPWAWVVLLVAPLAIWLIRLLYRPGGNLILALARTGQLELLFAIVLALALGLG